MEIIMATFRRSSVLISKIFSYELKINKQVTCITCSLAGFQTCAKKKLNIERNKDSVTKGPTETLLKAFANKHPALHGPSTKQNGVLDFQSLGLRHDLGNALKTFDIHQPTQIQISTIQKVLQGQNVLCASQTGSGKTLAYLLPIFHLIKNLEETEGVMSRQHRPRVCVVVPFRELAVQVLGVVKSLSHFTKLRSLGLISGRKKKWIREGLHNPIDIVVGTPQTLLEYQEKGDIYLSDLSHIVIDEADTMFDGSFISLAVDILKYARVTTASWSEDIPSIQATFVTTTVPQDMLKTMDSIIPNMQICTADLHQVLPHVSQKFLKIPQHQKSELLFDTVSKELQKSASKQIMVFCNTTKSCDWTSFFLEEHGLPHIRLNGNMHKKERRLHLKMFQEKQAAVLVCTDMASRGLDTTNVSHVINFDFPASVVDYIHRAGRTGRLGYSKTAIAPQVTSFLSHNREIITMEQIKKAMEQNIPLQDAALWKGFGKKKLQRS